MILISDKGPDSVTVYDDIGISDDIIVYVCSDSDIIQSSCV
jgi:hypothetical protein